MIHVRCSPRLGGELLCAPKQLRHYHSPDDLSWDEWRLSDSEVERIDLENAASPEEADELKEMTADEMAVDGYYVVAGIAHHEYKQGWKFLTLWDGYGLSEATTRNSPGAPAESPAARWRVRETGRVSDRVRTRQTTAAHAAQDQCRRDPPGTTPSRGPERVRRGARPAPLPRQGLAAGTMSPVLGRPPRAPRNHPVKPGATAPGVGEGTTATGKPTGAPDEESKKKCFSIALRHTLVVLEMH